MFAVLILMATACSHQSKQKAYSFVSKGRSVPAFSADSAYTYIKKQLSHGPRTIGSKSHRLTRQWLVHTLNYDSGNQVFVQHFTLMGYGNDTLHMSNIIAAFNPSAKDRIMLCAHWDTRPRSDQDSIAAYRDKPIPGADDGASGVAVLVELARLFHKNTPPIGVDLIFFDGEDYGKDDDLAYYFLGSRYWAQHQPVPGYKPRFGILLDMVGGVHATFLKEGMSMRVAPELVDGIWSVADKLGYGNIFKNQVSNGISDDHVVLNKYLDFTTIDIIDHSQTNGRVHFPPYWHTHRDNINIISKKTLHAIGSVLTHLIYNRF